MRRGFILIPSSAIYVGELQGAPLMVLCAMCDDFGHLGWNTTTRSRISRRLGISKMSVGLFINKLVEHGYIVPHETMPADLEGVNVIKYRIVEKQAKKGES